jgi:pimeloyl-ACP methyl ester carboxylesterase
VPAAPDSISVFDRSVTTAFGRELLVQEGGDPAGSAVLVQLGTPGSRVLYGPHLADAAERGIRLIAYDRPGYGGSTPHPGRSVSDCAEDVRTVIDALDIDRFAVWGVSGGGPHALACASLLPGRVVAAATLASPAPFDADGLDWWADTGQENIDDDRLILSDPEAARAKLAKDRLEFFEPSEPDVAAAHPTLFSPADAAVLTDELGDYFMRRNRTGLAPGIEGWWEDSVALLRPWGFAVDTIEVPVMVWHGRQDRMVPFGHGEWLARRLPSAEPHLSDEDGHLTLLQNRVPAVHAWLLAHF